MPAIPKGRGSSTADRSRSVGGCLRTVLVVEIHGLIVDRVAPPRGGREYAGLVLVGATRQRGKLMDEHC